METHSERTKMFLAPIIIASVYMCSSVSSYSSLPPACSRRTGFFTERSLSLSFSVYLSWSARQAALQRSGDEECDNKEVEDKEVLVHTLTHTHRQTQQRVVVMVSTALAPPYCKQGGGDRLPVLVNIISVIQQTPHCQHLAAPRHNQH